MLGTLTYLQFLYLEENKLSGAIPPELGNLTVLEEFYVSDNVLEGPVPTQILKSLADKSLLELALWGNDRLNWKGISDKLLKRVERAALSIFSEASGRDNWTKTNNWRNSFTFSDWYGVRTDSDGRVIELKLDNNNLTGEISDSLRDLARLKRLVLRQNKLSEAIPPELGDLTGLTHLLLGENQLRGAILSELGDLTGFLALGLSDNELSCDIPDLSPLSQLLDLKLQNNYQLGGTLEMGLTASLYDLNTSCTAIETPGITPLIIDCMETVQAACPSPPVSPREQEPAEQEPADPVTPPESPQSDGGGGCACTIASNAGASETSQGIVLNLILVMSALLVIPWRNHSAAKKT